jgi:hypothetical protein
MLVVKWIPGLEIKAEFTKNLDGPLFRYYRELLLGRGALSCGGGGLQSLSKRGV